MPAILIGICIGWIILFSVIPIMAETYDFIFTGDTTLSEITTRAILASLPAIIGLIVIRLRTGDWK